MEDAMIFNGKRLEGDWKVIKAKLMKLYREKINRIRRECLIEKPMQGKGFLSLDENSHHWMNCNIDFTKMSSIIQMQERMVETRAWKKNRGLVQEDGRRLCGKLARHKITFFLAVRN